MARRKRRSYRRKTTLPVATVAPIAWQVYDLGKAAMAGQGKWVMRRVTGINPDTGKLEIDPLVRTYGPVLAGFGISWLATRFGINRKLGQMRVPLIRI